MYGKINKCFSSFSYRTSRISWTAHERTAHHCCVPGRRRTPANTETRQSGRRARNCTVQARSRLGRRRGVTSDFRPPSSAIADIRYMRPRARELIITADVGIVVITAFCSSLLTVLAVYTNNNNNNNNNMVIIIIII